MKRGKGHRGRGRADSERRVRIEFSDARAETVAIVGTFNDWRPGVSPMVAVGGGRWLKELMLPPGRYEYLFVADGQWRADPQAKETKPNAFGGVNAVLRVVARAQEGGSGNVLKGGSKRARL